jgi:hypothetical protein
MYVWKCWRDTRAFFLVFLVVAAAAMPAIGLGCRGTTVMRETGITAVISTFGLLMMVIPLGLGTLGATHEFAEQATHFLFTKPRSRQYFLWVGWSVGAIEVLIIALVNLLAGWATMACYGGRFGAALFAPIEKQAQVELFLLGVFVYALTYSLTAVLRNGLKGLGGSMGILTGVNAFGVLMRVRWNIQWPVPVQKIGSLPLAPSYIVWMTVALLFVYAAQVALQRAEI